MDVNGDNLAQENGESSVVTTPADSDVVPKKRGRKKGTATKKKSELEPKKREEQDLALIRECVRENPFQLAKNKRKKNMTDSKFEHPTNNVSRSLKKLLQIREAVQIR